MNSYFGGKKDPAYEPTGLAWTGRELADMGIRYEQLLPWVKPVEATTPAAGTTPRSRRSA